VYAAQHFVAPHTGPSYDATAIDPKPAALRAIAAAFGNAAARQTRAACVNAPATIRECDRLLATDLPTDVRTAVEALRSARSAMLVSA
jgi:hypothetical protein